MHWFYLACAIILEVAGTVSMKVSEGFSKTTPSVLIFVFYGLSFVGLTLALKKIEVSMAYAIWAGVGTALIALIGIIYYDESVNILKMISLALIILGVIGLNLAGAQHGL